jgi:hypothetical protein
MTTDIYCCKANLSTQIIPRGIQDIQHTHREIMLRKSRVYA